MLDTTFSEPEPAPVRRQRVYLDDPDPHELKQLERIGRLKRRRRRVVARSYGLLTRKTGGAKRLSRRFEELGELYVKYVELSTKIERVELL